jgi:RND family efflux transporter MFP subunit
LVVDSAQQQLTSTQLRAPFDGIVSQINITAGALSISRATSAGTSIPAAIVLMDTTHLHVRLAVDEIDVGHIAEGQPVTLTLDALPDSTLSGHISSVAQVADPSATVVGYAVQVALDPSDAPIKVGMTAAASIIVRQLHHVVRVPNLYVRIDRRSGAAFVNLVNADGTLTEIAVQLGLRTEEYSEVIDGLNVGDHVGISLDSTFSILG